MMTMMMITTRMVQHFLLEERWDAFAFYPSLHFPTRTMIWRTPCFDCSAAEVTLLSMSSIISPWSAIISARSLKTVCTWFISVDRERISSWRSRISMSLYCRLALPGFTLLVRKREGDHLSNLFSTSSVSRYVELLLLIPPMQCIHGELRRIRSNVLFHFIDDILHLQRLLLLDAAKLGKLLQHLSLLVTLLFKWHILSLCLRVLIQFVQVLI